MATISIQQPNFDLVLQGPNLAAQRRLADVQTLSRAPKGEFLGDNNERAQMPQFHGLVFDAESSGKTQQSTQDAPRAPPPILLDMKILVTGGTGKVGGEVLKQLGQRDVELRALVRKKGASVPDGVEAVVGDLLDPVSVEKALSGVDKLYLLNGVSPDELTQGLIAYGLAKKLKLKHIVYHSVFRAEHFKDVPHFATKVAIESALREFDVPFTIIRPNYFYQNDTSLKEVLLGPGIYPMPLGTPGISAVDVRDIAEAAAIALTTDGHEGKTYNLNGPEILSGSRIAAIWSEVLGKKVQYTGEDMDAFENQMREKAPSWSAFDMRMMFQGYLERGFIAGEGDLEMLTQLLGHAPRSYEAFARETALSWQKK